MAISAGAELESLLNAKDSIVSAEDNKHKPLLARSSGLPCVGTILPFPVFVSFCPAGGNVRMIHSPCI